MYIIHGIPLRKTTHTQTLSYFSIQPIEIGQLARVPYGRQKLVLYVTGVQSLAQSKSDIKALAYQIKQIDEIIPGRPFHTGVFEALVEYNRQCNVPTHALMDLVFPREYVEHALELTEDNQPKQSQPAIDSGFYQTYLQRPETERIDIYAVRAREILSRDQSLVIIVSSSSQVASISSRVGRGVEDRVLGLSGLMTPKQLKEQYRTLMAEPESARIIVMTPYYLGTLPKNTGLIILHNSASDSYVTPKAPVTSLQKLIRLVAQKANIECMDSDTLIPLKDQPRDADWYAPPSYRTHARLELVEHSFTDNELLHQSIHEKIIQILEENEQAHIGIYVPRLGYASSVTCRDCGHTMQCDQCGGLVTLFRKNQTSYSCRRCGHAQALRDSCPVCLSHRWSMLGITIERLEEYLSEYFPDTEQYILTHKELQKKKYMREYFSEEGPRQRFSIGTGSLLQLDVHFDLLIVPSAAHLLGTYSYNSYEETLRTSMQIQEKCNVAYIQGNKEHVQILEPLIHTSYRDLVLQEQSLRAELNLPPHTHMRHWLLPSVSKSKLDAYLKNHTAISKDLELRVSDVSYPGNTRGSVASSMVSNPEKDTEVYRFLKKLDADVYSIPI